MLKQSISTKQRDALEKVGPCSNGRISDPEMPQRRRVGPAQLMFHLCLMSVAFGTHGHLVQKDEALNLSNWATMNSGAYEEPRPAQLDTSCKAKAIAPEAAKIVRATEAVCHCEWSKFEPLCRQVEVFNGTRS